MSNTIVRKLTDYLVQNQVIQSADREIYEYGLYEGAFMLLNLITDIVIAIIFGRFIECIIFLTAYIPLRSNSGGYHAKTHFRCYIFSTFVLLAALFIIQIAKEQTIILSTIAAICAAIIFFLAPVEDKNKPLDQKEIAVYGKRAKLILITELIIGTIFAFVGFNKGFASIMVAISILATMLLLGFLKNQKLQFNF